MGKIDLNFKQMLLKARLSVLKAQSPRYKCFVWPMQSSFSEEHFRHAFFGNAQSMTRHTF